MAMTINSPRLRSLLRQAHKVADSGKRAAAAQLYRQILEEAPDTDAAWVGLAEVEFDPVEKEKAYQRALSINPESRQAKNGLARLNGEVVEESPTIEEIKADVKNTAVSPNVQEKEPILETVEKINKASESYHHDHAQVTNQEAYDLVCYRHAGRETSLRCYNCNKPICSQCAVKTPVGYSCPDCIREKEDAFFNATPIDYILAPLVSLPLSLLAGFLVLRVGVGFIFILLTVFVGGAIGGLIGRVTKRFVGNRRGRYLPHVVATTVVLGVLIPAIPVLFALVIGNLGAITLLLVPGIYLFVATGAAFYQMK
jgi:hypothetical protein